MTDTPSVGRIQGSASGQETKQPKELTEFIFSETVSLMWVQAQALFGEDAPQVICDAVQTDDPAQYLRDYIPNALSSAH